MKKHEEHPHKGFKMPKHEKKKTAKLRHSKEELMEAHRHMKEHAR